MRNLDNFQKIPVKKKPKVKAKHGWKLNRKLQRKIKNIMQDKIYA